MPDRESMATSSELVGKAAQAVDTLRLYPPCGLELHETFGRRNRLEVRHRAPGKRSRHVGQTVAPCRRNGRALPEKRYAYFWRCGLYVRRFGVCATGDPAPTVALYCQNPVASLSLGA